MTSLHDEPIRILHVDDDPSVTDLTATFLERDNNQFAVQTATSADEGFDLIGDRPPDCIVSDYNMPGMDGIKFLQAVRAEHPDLPFILYTGKGSEAVASEAIAADVTDYLQKKAAPNSTNSWPTVSKTPSNPGAKLNGPSGRNN